MGKVKWTEESIREIAGAYASRTEMGHSGHRSITPTG